MSGIVGILNLDGSPVDGDLLGRMTAYLGFRGPDGQRVWAMNNVGFGHTLLRVTEETAREAQPFTLDGQRWIVADARVDARARSHRRPQDARPAGRRVRRDRTSN